jgi:hypothetical protein
MNDPVHREIVSVPLETVGVTVTLYPVEVVHEKLLATPLVTKISPIVSPLDDSVVVISTKIAHEIVFGAREVRVAPALIVSSVLESVILDAINWVAIHPVYTTPVERSRPCIHPLSLRSKSIEPVDSDQLWEKYEPVAVFPELSIVVMRNVSPTSSVPLRVKSIVYAPEFEIFTKLLFGEERIFSVLSMIVALIRTIGCMRTIMRKNNARVEETFFLIFFRKPSFFVVFISKGVNWIKLVYVLTANYVLLMKIHQIIRFILWIISVYCESLGRSIRSYNILKFQTIYLPINSYIANKKVCIIPINFDGIFKIIFDHVVYMLAFYLIV